MNELALKDFDLVRRLSEDQHRAVWVAASGQSREPVQLTVFAPEISQRMEFRRAFKTDRAMLSMLQHQSIQRFRGSGESDGQLFCLSDVCAFETLEIQLRNNRQFSSEDLIEIGWQVCSALQQAHNVGLVHGGLSAQTLRISDSLQVLVTDFGVHRWLKAAEQVSANAGDQTSLITVSALASRVDVDRDLQDLAAMLKSMAISLTDPAENAEPGRPSSRLLLDRLLSRATSSNPANRPVTAREFQGRLGEILIGSDDGMPLVDHRESAGTGRRSIVVELFEPPETLTGTQTKGDVSAGSAWRRHFLPVVVAVLLLVLITIIAGLVW